MTREAEPAMCKQMIIAMDSHGYSASEPLPKTFSEANDANELGCDYR
jgi:hypothetical protein